MHRLGAPLHTSTEPVGPRVTVRLLGDGRLLVDDSANSRLVLFDATLEHASVVADTSDATARAWGKGLAGLVPFAGDSSIVRDLLTGAYLVIDPSGRIARVIASPAVRPRGPEPTTGTPVGYDQAGHLLFRSSRPLFMLLLDQDFVGDTLMTGPDTVPILRRDLVTGRFDTLTLIRGPRVRQAIRRRAQGGGSGRAAINPIPAADDWTVLGDGTVAIARVADYHVDWIGANRARRSTGKVPTVWVPISLAQKAAMIDSLRARDSALVAERELATRGGVSLPTAVVDASDLPDYWPPFVSGTALPAPDGGLWIREGRTTTPTGPPVYDVIAHDGTLIDRVQLPFGTTLLAIGRGTVYFAQRLNGAAKLTEASVR